MHAQARSGRAKRATLLVYIYLYGVSSRDVQIRVIAASFMSASYFLAIEAAFDLPETFCACMC